MLLIIHNLPSTVSYPRIKSLLEERCGIQDAILDNLTPDNYGMKVTVGLAEEEDAAILFRKLNGYTMNGCQLLIEDVRKKRQKDKPPAANFNQQLSSNFEREQINMLQMQQAQLLAQTQMMGQSQSIPMMVPAPNYDSVMGMYALQQNSMMNYGGQLQQFPAMVPFSSQGARDPLGNNSNIGLQDNTLTNSHAWDGNGFKSSDQRIDMERQGRWDNPNDREGFNIRRSQSPHLDLQRPSRWDEQPVNDSYYDPHVTTKEPNYESTQPNDILPRAGSPNNNAGDGEPFSHPRMRYESRFGSKPHENRAYPSNSRNIPSPQGNRYDRENSRNVFGDSIRQSYDPGSEQFLLDSSRGEVTETPINSWNRPEAFEKHTSEAPFGRRDASFGSGSSDRYQNKSRPVPMKVFTSNPRNSNPSGFNSGMDRSTRPSGPSSFDNKPRSSGPRVGFSDTRSSGIRNTFENSKSGPRSTFDSNATSVARPNRPKSPYKSNWKAALPNDNQRSSSGPRAPFTNFLKHNPSKPAHPGSNKPSYVEQNRIAPQKRPYEKQSKFDEPKAKKFITKRISKELSIKDANKDLTWRNQAASEISKRMLYDLQMTELIDKFPFMHKLKSEIKSRIDSILQNRVLVPVVEIRRLYDRKFLRSEEQEFFLEVLDKVEKEAEAKAQAYESIHADEEKAKIKIEKEGTAKESAPEPETVVKPGPSSKPSPVTEQTPATKPVPGTKPITVSKPSAPKPGPSKVTQAANKPSASFSSTLADKKVQKAQKQMLKLEHKTENMYKLEPVVQKALDDEWAVIEKLYLKECSEPANENEKIICDGLLGDALEDLKRAVKLNVTKRLMNITTGLVVRVFAVGKLPKKESVALFLKRYGVLSLKKSDRTKMYVATVNSYEYFDTLCNLKDCNIDGISVSFRPMQAIKPSAKETRLLMHQRTTNFIKRQIEDAIGEQPKKDDNTHEQTDQETVAETPKNTDDVSVTNIEKTEEANEENNLSVEGERGQEDSETNLNNLSNDDKFSDEPKGLHDGDFVTLDEAGIDDEGDELKEGDEIGEGDEIEEGDEIGGDAFDDEHGVGNVDEHSIDVDEYCVDDDDLEDY